MNYRAKLFTFLFATLITLTLTLLQVSARSALGSSANASGFASLTLSQLTSNSLVAIDGIGPVRVGMTIAQAEAAAGVRLIERGGRAGEGGCYYVWPQPEIHGLEFMVISSRSDNSIDRQSDRIARVDVLRGSGMTTVSGAHIGNTEAQIKSLYPGRIEVTPHEYDHAGHYLTFVPQDLLDRNYRLVFETDGRRVTRFRAGRLPEVQYVEGCA